MFDNKEIARKALFRARQLKKIRKAKMQRTIVACSTLLICTISTTLFMTAPNSDKANPNDEPESKIIIDPQVPLARPPTTVIKLCTECGNEQKEETGSVIEQMEECEYCRLK